MSQENVEVVQRVLSEFGGAQQIPEGLFAPGWVFDVSTFHGWPGQQQFTGIEEFREFFAAGLSLTPIGCRRSSRFEMQVQTRSSPPCASTDGCETAGPGST